MSSNIVITGSTRGFGYGLASAFLDRGCNVIVSGRTLAAVDKAVSTLAESASDQRILGIACDVRHFDAVQILWDKAAERFGKIHIWINNAGVANRQAMVWKADAMEARSVVETNVLGSLYGSQVAMRGMLDQGAGAIYIVEGMGSDGRKHEGLALYGMTKYALRYLTESLVDETKETPVLVGSIRPGMLVTELLTEQYRHRPEEWEKAKRIFNIIADKVENVAPWAAEAVLTNGRHGARLTYLSRLGLMSRFLMAPFRKRDLFHGSSSGVS